MSRLILFALSLLLMASCGSGSSAPGRVSAPTAVTPLAAPSLSIAHDTLLDIHLASDTLQSYYLYSPAAAHEVQSAAVIVFFDPHGEGRLPVEKYRKLADRFGIVLAGSNNSKNGLNPAETCQFANNIIGDLSTRIGYKAANICLAGFSGGAKVALNTGANNTNITNIIYSGASTAITATHEVHLLGFAGTEDMNYTDLLAFAQANPDGRLVEFRGKHDWPDTATFRRAFYWLRFQLARMVPGSLDTVLVGQFLKETDRNIAALQKQNALLAAYQKCENAYGFINGLADAATYKTRMDAIAATAAYKAQLAQKSQTLQKEAQEKQVLIAAIRKENGDWWTRAIAHYHASTSPSDQRLLGFISLMCYSYSSQLLAQHNIKNAEFILNIYELADPENVDQLYFHALLYAMQNNKEQSLLYLTKAIHKGYNDREKIRGEPAFSQWQGDERFSRVISSLAPGAR